MLLENIFQDLTPLQINCFRQDKVKMPTGKKDAGGSLAGPIELIIMICIVYWLLINIKPIRHMNSTKSILQTGSLWFPRIISWPYRASQILIAGPIGPAIIISLAKIVLTLLRSFEHPGPVQQGCVVKSLLLVIITYLYVCN